jgi:hypothetical protein
MNSEETYSYRDMAADNFGAPVLKLAHAIQLAIRPLANRSNSIAYLKPPQQASKQSHLPCNLAPSLNLPTGQILDARPSKFSEAVENLLLLEVL